MKLNTLFTIHAVISIAYGIFGLVMTGMMVQLLFNNPPGTDAFILGRGWCACLVALGVLAWGARGLQDGKGRKLMALGFFVYFIIATVVWLFDQMARGWLVFGGVTFALLALFTVGYGYFLLVMPEAK